MTYQGEPGRPECWRVGDTERIEESTKASTALETAERPRREAQGRGAGQPEARTGLLEQGPSNSYFGGPYFISQDFTHATRAAGPGAAHGSAPTHERALTKGRVMADEDDVIEVVEEVEVDVLVDDDGNPVGAVVDDVIVASGPGGVVIDETIDVLDADGNISPHLGDIDNCLRRYVGASSSNCPGSKTQGYSDKSPSLGPSLPEKGLFLDEALAKVLARPRLHACMQPGKARFKGRIVVGRVGLEPTTTRL